MFTIRHLINSLQADSSRGYWASAFCCRLDDQHLQTMGQKNEEIMEYVIRFCTRRFPLNEKNKASVPVEGPGSQSSQSTAAAFPTRLVRACGHYLCPVSPGKCGPEERDVWCAEEFQWQLTTKERCFHGWTPFAFSREIILGILS